MFTNWPPRWPSDPAKLKYAMICYVYKLQELAQTCYDARKIILYFFSTCFW